MSVENELPQEENNQEATQAQQDPSLEQQDTAENQEVQAEQVQDEYKEKFVRLYAEFENYRRRTNQERLDLIASANGSLLKDLLPVLDDLDRAIANNEQLEDVQALREGFGLIQHKFKQILLSKGLKEMEAKGAAFDSDLHEAIANIPAPDAALKGKVIDDVEKGYYLNDKVLRFAKVVVGQ
ncbi:MAG: nucleotide exchange factor GrpE [Flavobacteriales bacterium]